MNFRSKVMLLGVIIVLLPMLVSTFVGTMLVLTQNEKDALESISESTRRITRGLKEIEVQYSDRGQKYAKTDNLVMYTNVLYRYHDYLTPEGYNTIQNDLTVDLSKLKIGLNVDLIEVRDAKNRLLAVNAPFKKPLYSAANERGENRDGIQYLLEDEKFILKSTSIIQKRSRLLGYLILTKYLDSVYLKEVSGVNSTEVAFFKNKQFLDGTVKKFTVKQISSIHPVAVTIHHIPYHFIFSPIYQQAGTKYYIAVGVSYLKTLQKITETAKILIGVALGAILVAVILTYYWSGRTVGPLLRLVSGVQAIGRGDLSQKIMVESSDEIGLLASEFNKMTVSLKESRDQLETANRNLYDMKEYISNIMNSMTMSVVVIDNECLITVVNSECKRLLGNPRNPLIGKNIEQTIALGDGESLFNELQLVRKTGQTQILTKIHCQMGGENFIANIRFSPLQDVNRSVAGVVLVIEDITARVGLEENLALSQKLASIGRLTSGLAHEINNPLGIIQNYIEVCRMDVQADKISSFLKRIESEIERIAQIIQRLLEFSRQSETKFKPVNLGDILEETLDLVEFKIRKEGIALVRDYIPDEALVMGDKSQLKQVFLNIILNAIQAMSQGGQLTIQLAESQDRKGFDLSFSDTGPGISKEHLTRIFDPFFTTKEVGEGTGLGLSVSYGIIQEHFGTIDVKSNPGSGSTFVIRLKRFSAMDKAGEI